MSEEKAERDEQHEHKHQKSGWRRAFQSSFPSGKKAAQNCAHPETPMKRFSTMLALAWTFRTVEGFVRAVLGRRGKTIGKFCAALGAVGEKRFAADIALALCDRQMVNNRMSLFTELIVINLGAHKCARSSFAASARRRTACEAPASQQKCSER